MNFEFLNNIVPVNIEKQERVYVSRKINRNPSGLAIRIYKDGSVYPSQELVDKFNLEYGVEGNNGLDVFSSNEWGQFPKGDDIPNLLLVAVVAKNEPKVSLFKETEYNEDGSPKNSVLEQGSKRPELIEKIREVYNMNTYQPEGYLYVEGTPALVDPLFDSSNHVDLEINTEVTIFAGLPQYIIPKKIVKGAKKGEMSYEIRQNLSVHPLTLKVDTEAVSVEVSQEESTLVA